MFSRKRGKHVVSLSADLSTYEHKRVCPVNELTKYHFNFLKLKPAILSIDIAASLSPSVSLTLPPLPLPPFPPSPLPPFPHRSTWKELISLKKADTSPFWLLYNFFSSRKTRKMQSKAIQIFSNFAVGLACSPEHPRSLHLQCPQVALPTKKLIHTES